MIRVGLTGTVGAGKSTVGRMFERWGAWRVDADDLARRAVEPGSPALEAIRERFGEAVIGSDGCLDRAALRRRVFGRPEEREALEGIVHPAVQALRAEALGAARGAGARVLVAEIPLLLEKELEDDFDVIVVVDAPQPVRRGRIQSERRLEPGTFEAIESAQWPAGRKRAAADLVIVNDGDLRQLERRARSAWDFILEREEGAR
ncbi:MAG: dephospho-CoA kinase [Candidatus Palauibacterales bacterium]|nr:dephospho-CoA kinase [Candidatus Palauibacterales bacterium]MDP2528882.1 dephospho-CoA kinase [Candidatus Palauibacterales bacterium]